MALDRITLQDFRNHPATRLDGAGTFNLLVGDNGAGKTNVLEALSLFAPGRGLRRAALAEMAGREGGGGFAVSALLDGGVGDGVSLGTATTAVAPSRRVVRINRAEAPVARLGEWLSVTWLTPAMDRLFVAAAGERRRFLDRLVLALDPAHARRVARYEAALRERNRLLGDVAKPDPAWLDALDAQLAEAGSAIAESRTTLVAALDSTLRDEAVGPFPRPTLAYAAAVEPGALEQALAAGRARDRAAGRTLSGPHRDDLLVTLDGVPAAACSTGQQKAMLIALVLAHARLLPRERPRLLLLDEVAAHLDPLRRAALFERLEGGGAQVWLTGTERAPFAALPAGAAVWEVVGGTVERTT